MKHTLVVLALLLGFILPVHAEKLADGNQLLHYCQLALRYADTHNLPSEDMSNASHCIGTVHGAADTLVWLDKIKTADGVTVEQEIRIVVKYMQDHPAKLAEPDVALILEALVEVFPMKGPAQ